MVGIFDLKNGAFDSSEAALLHQAYDIALQGLKGTEKIDRPFSQRLARSIVKVARNEPDCLHNDGSIDAVKLAQRAILRMLQTSAPIPGVPNLRTSSLGSDLPNQEMIGIGGDGPSKPSFRERFRRRATSPAIKLEPASPQTAESAAKIMSRLFERTPFAKL